MARKNSLISKIEVMPIRVYQMIAHPIYHVLPKIGINMRLCRFEPSCSEYAIEAIRKNGLLRGSIQGLHRIVRCNPFSHGGYDPVR